MQIHLLGPPIQNCNSLENLSSNKKLARRIVLKERISLLIKIMDSEKLVFLCTIPIPIKLQKTSTLIKKYDQIA